MNDRAVIHLIDPELGDRTIVCSERGDLAGAGRDLAVLLNVTGGDIALTGELLAFSRSDDSHGDRYRSVTAARAGDTHGFHYEVRKDLGQSLEVGVWNCPEGDAWQAIMKPADGTKHGPSGPPAGAAQSTKKRKKDADHLPLATFVDLVNRANRKLDPVPVDEAIEVTSLDQWLAGWRPIGGTEMVAIKRASIAEDRAFARGEEPEAYEDEPGMTP